MFDKFSRSWSLIKASASVLRQHKKLLVFPLFSAIAAILVTATFIFPLLTTGGFNRVEHGQDPRSAFYVLVFMFYLSQYFVIFFFNAALVGAAMMSLDGDDPTVGDGLRIASSKMISILGYALIAATVGLILQIIRERAALLGKLIAGALGMAFTVATFLTVPILVTRDVGPIDAIKESASLLKETWGENIIGNGGISALFAMFYILLTLGFLAVFLLAPVKSIALMEGVFGTFVIAVAMIALIQTALQGVYAAALYRYASSGADEGQPVFRGPLLQDSFRAKN